MYADEKLYQGAIIRIGRVRTQPTRKRIRARIIQPATTEMTVLKYSKECIKCEKVHIECQADGYPLPTVSWSTADGKLLIAGTGHVNYTIPEVIELASYSCKAIQPYATESRMLIVGPVELTSPRIKNVNPITRDGKFVRLEWEPVEYADHYVIHLNINKSSLGMCCTTMVNSQ